MVLHTHTQCINNKLAFQDVIWFDSQERKLVLKQHNKTHTEKESKKTKFEWAPKKSEWIKSYMFIFIGVLVYPVMFILFIIIIIIIDNNNNNSSRLYYCSFDHNHLVLWWCYVYWSWFVHHHHDVFIHVHFNFFFILRLIILDTQNTHTHTHQERFINEEEVMKWKNCLDIWDPICTEIRSCARICANLFSVFICVAKHLTW